MTQRLHPGLALVGLSLAIVACSPATPPVDSGETVSSAAISSDSSSSYVQQLPMEDGYEDEESSSIDAMEKTTTSSVAAAKSSPASSPAPAPAPTPAPAPVSSAAAVSLPASSPAPAPAPTPVPAKTVTIEVSNFAFAPNVITVKKGQKVTLRLKGVSGHHGVGIPQLGINTVVDEGKTVDIDLPTDQAGTFSFRCTIPCGPGHKDMTGTITITE